MGAASGSARRTYLRRMIRRRKKCPGRKSSCSLISSPMQRHASGQALTGSGSIICSGFDREILRNARPACFGPLLCSSAIFACLRRLVFLDGGRRFSRHILPKEQVQLARIEFLALAPVELANEQIDLLFEQCDMLTKLGDLLLLLLEFGHVAESNIDPDWRYH